jgi:hypothetical protein
MALSRAEVRQTVVGKIGEVTLNGMLRFLEERGELL